MKLIYPDKKITEEGVFELIDFAVEGRKRVKDQLYLIDETFKTELACFDYIIKSNGEEVKVETLEKMNTLRLFPEKERAEQATAIEETTEKSSSKKSRIPTKSVLRNLSVRENQTGISYESLFAAYLKGATEIRIEDPYIRYPYQVKNLVELISLVIKLNDNENEIKIHLVTWNTEEHTPDSVDAFDEIQESVANAGIVFTYEFKDFHDRKIQTDTVGRLF
jgi:ATP-dependent Lon protease